MFGVKWWNVGSELVGASEGYVVLFFCEFVFLVAQFVDIFAVKGLWFLIVADCLIFSPYMAFVTLDPAFYLVFFSFKLHLMHISWCFLYLLAEFELHSLFFFHFLFFLLLFLDFIVHKGFELLKLLCLGKRCWININILFSRFLRISVCSDLTLFLEHWQGRDLGIWLSQSRVP